MVQSDYGIYGISGTFQKKRPDNLGNDCHLEFSENIKTGTMELKIMQFSFSLKEIWSV